jgi:hypothetical protein
MHYERFSGCRRLFCGGYTTEDYITDPAEASDLSTHLPRSGITGSTSFDHRQSSTRPGRTRSVRTCRDPVDPDDLEPDGLRLGEAAIRARLLRLAEARRKGHLDAPRSDLPASFRRFVGPPMKDHGGPPSVTTFGEASGFSPPPSSPSRQLPTSALGAAVQRPSRFAVACAAEAFATPPRRTTSGTTALLAQPKGARHDVAEEREVALGLWMRSPVDDDLAADELIAVFNDVEDDVARVAGQHAAVVGAE